VSSLTFPVYFPPMPYFENSGQIKFFENAFVRNPFIAGIKKRFSGFHLALGLFRQLSFGFGGRHVPASSESLKQFVGDRKVSFWNTI